MTNEQLLIGAISGLSGVVVYLFAKLQKREDQLIELGGKVNNGFLEKFKNALEILQSYSVAKREKMQDGDKRD